jgi:hypothetical protein
VFFAITNFLGFWTGLAIFGSTAYMRWGLSLTEIEEFYDENLESIINMSFTQFIDSLTIIVLILAVVMLIITSVGFIAMCSGNLCLITLYLVILCIGFLFNAAGSIYYIKTLNDETIVTGASSNAFVYLILSLQWSVHVLCIGGVDYVRRQVSNYGKNGRGNQVELAMYQPQSNMIYIPAQYSREPSIMKY